MQTAIPNPGEAAERRYEVVLNRSSGTLLERWHEGLPRELEEKFAEHGVRATVRVAGPDGLRGALEAAVAAHPDAVIVGGGDGTVAGAAALLMGTEMPLGILPFGTFNLAARDAGVPLDPDRAVAELARGVPRPTDLLEVGGRVCLCTMLLGFYPAMAMREREYHGSAWWRKSLRIARGMFGAFRRGAPLVLEIDTRENGHIERRTRFVALVPGAYEDVISVIPKRRELPDARMSVYVSRHETLTGLARASLAYLFGVLRAEKDLERIETRGVRLGVRRRRRVPVMIDGEVMKLSLPLEVRLRKGGLLMLKPGEGEE